MVFKRTVKLFLLGVVLQALLLPDWGCYASRDTRASHDNKTAEELQAPCRAEGKGKIEISCRYREMRFTKSRGMTDDRLRLNRFELAFNPIDEGPMLARLEFTNAGRHVLSKDLVLSLSIDDVDGRNHLRRRLSVNLSTIEPGRTRKFQESLLAGALMPGKYWVRLQIFADPLPSDEVSSSIILLNDVGVPDPQSGTNTLLFLTVDR